MDFLVTFSSGLTHIVEMKMLKGRDVVGPTQLATYMKHRQRREGWLVFFDARHPNRKLAVPQTFPVPSGTIRTLVVEINPSAPSKQV